MTSHGSTDFGPLVLGGNVFGWTADESASFAVLDAFVEAGGTAIDTADSYSMWVDGHSGGESERIVGNWLTARPGMRDRVSIATKVFSKPDRHGLAPANVRAALAESLDRLQTDHLDLYYAHRDDPEVPQEDVVLTFGELVAEGLVNRLGASNFSAVRLRSAVDVATAHGLEPFTVSQDGYSLVQRDIELGLVPTLKALNIIELPYGALQGGFLTGKYRPGVAVDSPRAPQATQLLERPRNVELLDALSAVAEGRGASMAAVALAWLRQQPRVAAPIASARSVEQLHSLVESFTLTLSEDELARLA
jgi:aryl-alcohol dehydrogenase-like predicted oxidoreductase